MKSLGLSIKFILVTSLLLAAFGISQAQTQTVYNSIPKPLPANVSSLGFEATSVREFGDGLQLANGAGGTLGQVKVIMSSWACQYGNWSTKNCVTTPGATFSQPLTINVYSVGLGNSVGDTLGTITQTFDIPYRPTSTPDKCGGDTEVWFNNKEKTCYHGLAVPVIVNFSDQHIVIPDNAKIIVTIAFNTSHYGAHPQGQNTPCYTGSGGCPYDSLNVSASGPGALDGDGAPLDLDDTYVWYQSGSGLTLDTGWTGYHPQIHVMANTNTKPASNKISTP